MRRLFYTITVFFFALPMFANGMDYAKSKAALEDLKTAYPGIGFYTDGDRVTRIYGRSFGAGSSPVNMAEQFQTRFSALFGVDLDNLIPGSVVDENHLVQPVMYDSDTGEYKFTLVYGITVQDAVIEQTAQVPTRSEWGMIPLSLFPMVAGTMADARRRQTLEAGAN